MTDKIDIPSFQIAASKMHANGNAYFKLFEKHVPKDLDQNSVVLLYKLDNLSCIYKIVNMNSKAHYVVVSNDAVNNALQVVLDKAIDVEYIKEFDFKETDMKFDCIVMNPPYQRNLHLKILAEAITHLKDEKSVCVNLSPVRWLQDPLAKYKKNSDYNRFNESINKHIDNLDIIDMLNSNSNFDIRISFDLGVYVCYKEQLNKDFGAFSPLLDKIMAKIKNLTSIDDHIEVKKIDGWRCKVTAICSIDEAVNATTDINNRMHWLINSRTKTYVYKDGYTEDGDFWTALINKNQWTKDNGPLPYSVKFNSKEEAYNFEKYCKTYFLNAIKNLVQRDVHVPLYAMPWLGDAVNPRTGLKGYIGDWTDDDLYKFFNITPEEQKVIEETMEKYK